ncbi:hypothetical protein [Castellaniella sp.]|uniref:hypothetical protein n=1 Tax=Castellaniella sp. TaxID=1955812 RepID=UPI003A8FEADD
MSLEVKNNGATHFRPNFGGVSMSGPKRIPAVQARLDRWAIWVHGSSGGLGGGGSTLGYLMDLAAGRRVGSDDGHGSTVPVDSIECSLTDDAILALPQDLQQAVRAWHLARTGTLEEVARRHGIVKTTLWRRLGQADHRISEWLAKRRFSNK